MAYTPTNWTNFPSTATPVNASNLNKIENELVALDTGKADESAVTTALEDKVDKVAGKGLSEEDYTTEDKTKLAGISAEANKVEITPVVTEGTTLATISIDGVDTAIKGSDIDVDDELSPTSENPVQNKVIYETLQNILPEETAEGNPISITDASGLSAKSCEVTFSPIQSGSGDPSPSNIRPFSGRDSVVLAQSGKNLVNWNVGKFSGGTGLVVTLIKGTYTLSQSVDVNTGDWYIKAQKSDSTYCSKDELGLSSWASSSTEGVYYGSSNAHYITFTIPESDVEVQIGTQNNPATDTPAQLEVGSVRTDYVPYVSYSTKTKTFPNTVYGVKLDFVSGKLAITDILITFDGTEEEWGKAGTDGTNSRYYIPIIDEVKSGDIGICNYLVRSAGNTGEWGTYNIGSNLFIVKDKDNNFQDLEAFKTYLGTNHLQLCYELATPTEITITPETIELLKGNNTLWTDGDSVKLVYSADIKAYIDSQLNS